MHRLIVNADDFGISKQVNDAIKICFEKRYINQATLMVNMPFTEDAVGIARRSGFSDYLGLHLNLVEGKPLTTEIRRTILCDSNGVFRESALKGLSNRFYLDSTTRKGVRIEIIAQIEKYLSFKIGRRHIDSHQHSHISPSIFKILLPILEEYGFEDIRLARNIPLDEIALLRRIVKGRINRAILNYNFKHSSITPLAFGSMSDICKCEKLPVLSEMMIHPILINGDIKEAFSEGAIDRWWDEHKDEYVLM